MFQAISSISKISARARAFARFFVRNANKTSKFCFFTGFMLLTLHTTHPVILSHFHAIIRSCGCVKVQSLRVRQYVFVCKYCKKHDHLQSAIAPQNGWWPPIFFSYFERVGTVDAISCIIWSLNTSWRHHIAIWIEKINFHVWLHKLFYPFLRISVIFGQFCSKFQYVIAETLLYEKLALIFQ